MRDLLHAFTEPTSGALALQQQMTEQLAAMSADVEELNSRIGPAVADGQLMESTAKNIRTLLAGAPTDLYFNSVNQLADSCEWSELNDRFYQTLAFGTGGLRGRTIGKIITTAERGNAREDEPPQFPCVGTNAMNFFNINRATRGLVAYLHDWNRRQQISAKPKLVIAHDPRLFSKEFAELAARVAAETGCDACVFDDPRSVPELSFTVRYLKASAGIVITASHNPPYDNGYKVYFSDGAQVIEPHASGIIAKVNAITTESFTPLPKDRQGKVSTIGKDIDQAYMRRLETLILDPQVIREAKLLRIIYTPLHGTGSVIIKPMLTRLGFNFQVVPEQDRFDGRFPTVKSPNPENAEALTMAINLAQKEDADLVVATDGLRCVETLTGFKYIGEKLGKYEHAIPEQLRQNYAHLTEQETRRLRLAHSSFYVFGGEESYGYSGADFVRDKDGNGAVIMFCEVAAYAKSRGQTVDELLDEIFATFGYFEEKTRARVFEGAEGANKIARLIESYGASPFLEVLGSRVIGIKNFEMDMVEDVEGDLVPKEKMLIFELEDLAGAGRIAVRPSGTEPKIKYYLFAQRRPENGKFDPAELSRIKAQVGEKLDRLWDWLQQDAESRLSPR